MARKKSNSDPPRFPPGMKVRVRHGVRDPDFPDIPQGGWAGTIKEVEQSKGHATYLVAWVRTPLRGMHPFDENFCERDSLERESIWLGDENLETDDGTRVPSDPPTSIDTNPLSQKDQDDRVRMALGLTHDDPLPEACRKTLLDYHRSLAANMRFPFRARSEGDGTSLTVHWLPAPREHDLDEEEGLLCEAKDRERSFDVPLAEPDEAGSGNRKLVGGYGY